MVPQHGEDAMLGPQPGYRLSGRVNVLVTLVDKITGDRGQIGSLCISQRNGFVDVRDRYLPAAVKVRKLHDAESVKRGRQTGNGNVETIQFKPSWLNMKAIAHSGPSLAQPVRPAAKRARIKIQMRQMKIHEGSGNPSSTSQGRSIPL